MNMTKKLWIIPLILLFCAIPTTAHGAGHEKCTICHVSVEDGNYTLTIKPNFNAVNPNTGKSYCNEDAFCMGCHTMEAKSIHPVGVIPNPTKVSLPQNAKGKGGEIICLSCHDIHPDNKNYRYLRWPSDGGKKISSFCVAHCHTQYAAPTHTSNRLSPPYLLSKKSK